MPRCRYCKELYKPTRPMQPGRVCNSVECQYKHSIEFLSLQGKKKAKAERVAAIADRKEIKLKREQLKTRSDYIKEAQIAFNAFIRERDKDQLCICCGKPLQSGTVGGEYDCGHYRSVGSAPHLRFDERNAHAQRKQCNRYGAGRAVDYRLGLIARIGIENVERLEADNEPRKLDVENLIAIRNEYRCKLKELKGKRNCS